jgi:hypothetical protein
MGGSLFGKTNWRMVATTLVTVKTRAKAQKTIFTSPKISSPAGKETFQQMPLLSFPQLINRPLSKVHQSMLRMPLL